MLTAPEGYVLQLSGNITTQKNWDNLTVYDNSEASGTKLLDAVSSTSCLELQSDCRSQFFTIGGSRHQDNVRVEHLDSFADCCGEVIHVEDVEFGVLAEESVFIDDVPANIEAALNIGMKGIVFHDDVKELRRKLAQMDIKLPQ